MTAVERVRTSTPTLERETSRVSFGPESSIHTGPIIEDLSRDLEVNTDEDEPPAIFHVSDTEEVGLIL